MGNPTFRARLELMVRELGKVQLALGTGGYLSAFPTTWFDRMEAFEPVWAPYYTIHKIIAGLVDAYELGGQAEALPMAVRMVAYHWNHTRDVVRRRGAAHWQQMLGYEFGGMNEILYRLHRITGDRMHLEFARVFDKRVFLRDMVNGRDNLYDMHANTHLAQVVGFAAGYDSTGNATLRSAVSHFFDIVTQHHGYATGGTSVFERWEHRDNYAYAIAERYGAEWVPRNSLKTHETCTQYNILKIARSLFQWTGDVLYADHYERALLNGMLGTARLPPEDWPEGHAGHASHHHHHHSHLEHVRKGLLAAGAGGGGGAKHGGSGAEAIVAGHAAQLAAQAGSLAAPYRRFHDDEWGDFIGFRRPRPEWNVSDAHGPGVFLYLLPMGHGQSKSDNLHHWGFPFHSFWCCYGTIIESYAKLADSIYFRDMNPRDTSAGHLPPRLYINQFASSQLTWREMGLRLTMTADPYAPGPATTAEIRFARLPVSEAASSPPPDSLATSAAASTGGSGFRSVAARFTLMLRIPSWAARRGTQLELNGLAFNGCPGAPQPGRYCAITRQAGRHWSPRDVLSVRVALRWWYSPAHDSRPDYSTLKALMLGPHLMAALSHGDYTLGLPAAAAAGRSLADPGPDLRGRVYPPEEADELLTLTAGWNSSLAVRHDSQLLYVSALEDGGDAMDATFRLGRGCHHGGSGGGGAEEGAEEGSAAAGSAHHRLLSALHGHGQTGGDGAASGQSHGSLSGAFSSLHSLMRLGQHDSGQQLSLESMSYPNHYIAYDHTDVVVLQPGSPGAGADAPFAPCSRALWMMRPGLDGAPDTVSFEAAQRPGHYLSAQLPPAGPGERDGEVDEAACKDAPEADCAAAVPNGCGTNAFIARVLCRRTCGSCGGPLSAVRLRPQAVGSPAFAAASSFRLSPPARRAYPAGSYVLAGLNRHYLLAPLGNLVDERYTAYFNVLTEDVVPRARRKKGEAGRGGGAGGGAQWGADAREQGPGVRSSVAFLLDEGVGKGGWPKAGE
ncbi:hypothetical protein GPECTOR_1g348 [Gonium pectorale]|uniref:ShKT domain-containing protein n=1 Tax=Gonium pectorale TaxID=33097 RepID=A0A150H326_GONPE|nr:hypothetical protein GPECTOR_1g348 [Gonium pectorale]|eukprot:KXZ56392.1 hypothetical protein GPECTOR_1g348 [Gonium pectorale]